MSGPTPNAPTPSGLDAQGLPIGYIHRPEWEWTPRATAARLGDRDAAPILLLDCRTEQERAIASIAGSFFVPLHLLESKVDEIRDQLEERGAGTVVVHCHHGVRSLRATAILRAAGLDAHSMAGGIHLWSLDIDRSVPTY